MNGLNELWVVAIALGLWILSLLSLFLVRALRLSRPRFARPLQLVTPAPHFLSYSVALSRQEWHELAPLASLPYAERQIIRPTLELVPGPVFVPLRPQETLLYADDIAASQTHIAYWMLDDNAPILRAS